jgi:hypothetical protein
LFRLQINFCQRNSAARNLHASARKSYFVRFVPRSCIGFIVLLSIGARAATYQFEAQTGAPHAQLKWADETPTTFWERFEFATLRRAEEVFTDRFHSLNTLNWQMEMASRDADDFRDYATLQARRSLSRSITTGFREVAFDLPVVAWLKEHRGLFADLVLRAVDTSDEEAVSPLDPSYRLRERSWWRRLSESRDFRYGIRPFRTSPYAFVSGNVWRGDAHVVLAHVRYHYRQFAEHQFEFAFSVPLADGFAVDLGTAYHPAAETDQHRMVFRLTREFAAGGLLHVGFEMRDEPRFLAGVTVPL